MCIRDRLSPDSGTTSGSRQTLITGEAVRMAAVDLKKDLDEAGGDLSKLEGKEYFAEFFDPTDKLGADVPFPKSHVAYGFAAHVVVLDDEGKVKEVYAAHDSGRVVNPTSIQGQIEGGVLMGMGYAPVSYTHLNVSGGRLVAKTPGAQGKALSVGYQLNISGGEVILSAAGDYAASVSYTHLDVYKRQ